ncbi:uncharacterized protein J3R85_003026 [Psidium guajava]|nr:uncharacterized protein J3R85_003026 [Psidium guajava]
MESNHGRIRIIRGIVVPTGCGASPDRDMEGEKRRSSIDAHAPSDDGSGLRIIARRRNRIVQKPRFFRICPRGPLQTVFIFGPSTRAPPKEEVGAAFAIVHRCRE